MKSRNSEYHAIKKLLLKKPETAFESPTKINQEWKNLNYISAPDLKSAKDEYEHFADQFKKAEIDILYLDDGNLNTTLDSIYVRDASIATSEGMIICSMGKDERKSEPYNQAEFFKNNNIDLLGQITGRGKVEGGDVAWVNEELLAVGRGYRTNVEGIQQIKKLLSGFAEVVEVHLPHFRGPSDVFHLMSIFSPVDNDLAVVYSPLMPVAFREMLVGQGYKLVEVPKEEFDSQGCNVLALAPRKCLMLEGNPITKQRLEEAGAEVIEFTGSEISLKGSGGPTCLTRPIERW